MDLSASTVLVTGANRGFGRALATELLGRGATVYAGARNPDQVDLPAPSSYASGLRQPLAESVSRAGTSTARPDMRPAPRGRDRSP